MATRSVLRPITWVLAAVGIAVAVMAVRSRTEVGLVWIRTASHIGYAQLTPRQLDLALWARSDYDPAQHARVRCTAGPFTVLTSTEATVDQPAATAEKLVDAGRAWQAGGFAYVRGNTFPPVTPSQREAWVPTWFVVSVAVAPAMVTLVRRRKAARTAAAPLPWWRYPSRPLAAVAAVAACLAVLAIGM